VRRLRVLEFIKGLDIGGAEVLLAEHLRLADHDQFEYSLAYLDAERNRLGATIEELGVSVCCLNSRSVLDLRWVVRLRRHIVHNNIDIVHVHSPLAAVGLRAAVCRLGRMRPIIVTTEHSVSYRTISYLLDYATVHVDDLVLAVSDAVGQSAICRSAKRLEIVNYGVNVTQLHAWRRERDNIASSFELHEGPRVVCVANLRPEKGQKTLLQAARLVHAELPDVHFYLAGHGPLAGWIDDQIRRQGMNSYFHCLGLVPSAARLTACADVFVLPSDREGRPVALMEAMAVGTPAVATAVGGVSGMIRHLENGLLSPPNDSEALASLLVLLLTDESLRRRLGDAAFETGKGYDLAIATTRIESLFLELARGR